MLIEKSRSGVYQDNPENRRLHRVGQRYGEQKQSEEKKGGDDGVRDVEIVTSKQGVKTFLSGKVGGDYYKAVAEAHKALKRSGKNKSVSLMLAESGSGEPSKDVPARKYVEAVNGGASHDEAVVFANGCYDELLAKIKNVQEKVHSEGVSSSASTKMFAAVNKWFNDQKFEKKVISESKSIADRMKEAGFKQTNEGWEKSNGDITVSVKKLASGYYIGANDGKPKTLVPTQAHFSGDPFEKMLAAVDKRLVSAEAARKQAEEIDRGVRAAEEKHNLEEIKRINEKMNAFMKKQPDADKKSTETSEKPTSRVTFVDVPHAKDVNLKKYLTDSRRKQVDYLMKAAEVMPKSTLKQMHDEAVKKFNDNFDSMKKSERASALYVIMKYKDLMNKKSLNKEKNMKMHDDIVKRMSDAKVSFGSIEDVLREGARSKSGDSGAYVGDIEVDLSGSYNEHAWNSSGRNKPKKTYQLIIHTKKIDGVDNFGIVRAFNDGTLTRDQIESVTLAESNPWEGYWTKIREVDLDDMPVKADRK